MPFYPAVKTEDCDRIEHQNRDYVKMMNSLSSHYYLGQYFKSTKTTHAMQKFFVDHVKKYSKPVDSVVQGEHIFCDCIATELDYGEGSKFAIFNYDRGDIVATFPWTSGVELANISKYFSPTTHSCLWVDPDKFFMQKPGPLGVYNAVMKQIECENAHLEFSW